MVYTFIKCFIRLALKIFCPSWQLIGKEKLFTNGPVLITANHPNSFLDAIIIGSLFNRRVHFLARGDVFTKPWHDKLLRMLNMIPVYRLSEGKENLRLNEHAFVKSGQILAQNGIVLIFIEGISRHTDELQPFKKGAARIALAYNGKQPLQVLPLRISYDSYDRFGKNICIRVDNCLPVSQLFPFEDEAKNIKNFNGVVYEKMSRLAGSRSIKKEKGLLSKALLFIPAMIGYVTHILFYRGIKNLVVKKTKHTVFFDSVLFGILLFLYPLYDILLCIILFTCGIPFHFVILFFVLLPLVAWCAVQWRRSFQRI